MPVYDLRLLGLRVATAGRLTGDAIRLLLLLNSADAFCVSNVFNLEEPRAHSLRACHGVFSTRAPVRVLAAAMLAWIELPLAGTSTAG